MLADAIMVCRVWTSTVLKAPEMSKKIIWVLSFLSDLDSISVMMLLMLLVVL